VVDKPGSGVYHDRHGPGLGKWLAATETPLSQAPEARVGGPRRTPSPSARRMLVAGAVLLGLAAGVTLALKSKAPRRVVKQAVIETAKQFYPESLIFGDQGRANILLIGEDLNIDQHGIVHEDQPSRSDTNILISIEQASHGVYVLSIPRDMRAVIPGQGGYHKINAAHRYGQQKLCEAVTLNYGLRCDHWIKSDFRGFEKLIDVIGGLDVDVERDMDYDDTWQDFHVHLKKGPQHLNGDQCEGYVRWRKSKTGQVDPEGDIGRVKRQQKVLKLLAAKLLTPTAVIKVPELLRTIRQYVKTDLTEPQLLSLATFLGAVNPDTIQTATLPGDYKQPFLYIRREEAMKLLPPLFAETFNPVALTSPPTPHGSAAKGKDDDDDDDVDEDPGDDHPTPPHHATTTKPSKPDKADKPEKADKPDKSDKSTHSANDKDNVGKDPATPAKDKH